MNKKNYKNGFTLLEILIASAIFASVLIFTTATIAQGSTFQGKLRTMREVNFEAKKIADQITRDVREANSRITVKDGSNDLRSFRNGVAILCFYNSWDIYKHKNSDVGDNPTNYPDPVNVRNRRSYDTNVLITAKDGKAKIYVSGFHEEEMIDRNNTDKTGLYYKEFDLATITTITSTQINETVSSGEMISSDKVDLFIKFGGFAPSDVTTLRQQPYVQFYITARTHDYDSLSVSRRYETMIRSTATSRSYNQ